MAATALDTFLKTNTTLSGGNLIATSTGAGGARSSRPMSGLTYFEGVITTLAGTPLIGIASSLWDNATALGTGANTIGYQPSGVVRNNNATLTTLAAYVQGDRIGTAVDVLNRLLWFRVNAGNWNNNVANSPATGVGGIDFSAIAIETIEAAISASITGTVWTMTFTPAFTNAAPGSYVTMDTIGYSATKSVTNPTELPAFASPTTVIQANPSIDQTTHGKHFSPAGAITVVSGTTKETGVLAASKKVEVYDRVTGELLGSVLSDGSGNWSLSCLGRPNVRVVGSDPTTYNSVVYDNVVPV